MTIPSVSKASGGPATVVQHLSEHLVAAGVAVTLFTAAAEPEVSQVLPRDAQVNVISGSIDELRQAVSAVDRDGGLLIHDFGIWMPANHAVVSVSQELNLPLIISPCGMLAPWALQHKRWKKQVAWWLYQKRDLSRAALLVATAPAEQRDIQRLFPRKPIALIPNGVTVPEELKTKAESRKQKAETIGGKAEIEEVENRNETTVHGPGTKGPEVRSQKSVVSGQSALVPASLRTAVFLGRIYPVKGLKNLIEAWSVVRPAGWQCILAGPDQAGHQAELETMLNSHNLQASFQFPGLMEDAAKWNLLQQADLFVLPSFTENFGIAVAEALACGVPVITTKGTPWQDLSEHRCGWWVDIGVEPLVAALREATSRSDQERHEMGQRGQQLVEEKYAWPKIAGNLLVAYRWLLSSGPKPECVV